LNLRAFFFSHRWSKSCRTDLFHVCLVVKKKESLFLNRFQPFVNNVHGQRTVRTSKSRRWTLRWEGWKNKWKSVRKVLFPAKKATLKRQSLSVSEFFAIFYFLILNVWNVAFVASLSLSPEIIHNSCDHPEVTQLVLVSHYFLFSFECHMGPGIGWHVGHIRIVFARLAERHLSRPFHSPAHFWTLIDSFMWIS